MVGREIVPVCEMIRSFRSPVLFNCRSLRVWVLLRESPIEWRRLASFVRRHPELARRRYGWELVRAGHAVPVLPEFVLSPQVRGN